MDHPAREDYHAVVAGLDVAEAFARPPLSSFDATIIQAKLAPAERLWAPMEVVHVGDEPVRNLFRTTVVVRSVKIAVVAGREMSFQRFPLRPRQVEQGIAVANMLHEHLLDSGLEREVEGDSRPPVIVVPGAHAGNREGSLACDCLVEEFAVQL